MIVWVKRRRAKTKDDYETWVEGGVCPTLNVMDNTSDGYATVLAFSHTQGIDPQISSRATPTLRAEGGGMAAMVERQDHPAYVRRLTPLECERLQGFPDDWTDQQPDSARFKQLGNAVAVPVVEWIIGRLVEVDRERA